MSARYKLKKLPAEFGPETKFELAPVPAAPYRVVQENRFEKLKTALLAERLAETWESRLNSHVRRAANEAAALAWTTSYPLLVFPVLFQEKADDAMRVNERQEEVRRRTRELLAL